MGSLTVPVSEDIKLIVKLIRIYLRQRGIRTGCGGKFVYKSAEYVTIGIQHPINVPDGVTGFIYISVSEDRILLLLVAEGLRQSDLLEYCKDKSECSLPYRVAVTPYGLTPAENSPPYHYSYRVPAE